MNSQQLWELQKKIPNVNADVNKNLRAFFKLMNTKKCIN